MYQNTNLERESERIQTLTSEQLRLTKENQQLESYVMSRDAEASSLLRKLQTEECLVAEKTALYEEAKADSMESKAFTAQIQARLGGICSVVMVL